MVGYIFDFSHFTIKSITSRIQNQDQRYIEGYLVENQSDIDQAIIILTQVGLTRYEDNQIKPQLAKSWEISPDGKNYKFSLIDQVSSEGIKNILLDSGADWTDINITNPDEHTIFFSLKKPFAPLLSNLTTPIFDYGPYTLYLQTDTDTILRPNPKALEKPIINEVIFRQYSDLKTLSNALRDRRIDGSSETVENIVGFNRYAVELNRFPVLICNINISPCNEITWRDKFFFNKKFESKQDVEIIAVDSQENRQIVTREMLNWQKNNIEVKIKWLSVDELNKEILPERKFSLLLFGMDFGIDNDPYPFWHSSQIEYPGLNISGISDFDIDQIVERYRIKIDSVSRSTILNEFFKKRNELTVCKIYDPIVDYFMVTDKITVPRVMIKGFKSSDRFQDIAKWSR